MMRQMGTLAYRKCELLPHLLDGISSGCGFCLDVQYLVATGGFHRNNYKTIMITANSSFYSNTVNRA